MPLSHRRLAAWYVQLAQQLDAGLPLADALRASQRASAPPAVIAAMIAAIEQGGSTDDALRAAGTRLPLSDQLALSAAADAGRMPITLRALAVRHSQLGAAKLRVALACVYPLAILHLGLLLLPIMRMIDWQTGFHWSLAVYLRDIAVTLIPVWTIIIVLIVLSRRQSVLLRQVANVLPALRGYVRMQALADLAFNLGNFLEAGVPIGQAWAAAGLITRSRELRLAAEAMTAVVERGEPPGHRIASWPCFPPEFAAHYQTGEKTGQLEASLARLTAQYQESAGRSLTLATMIYPALMFLAVAGTVVYFIVTIYAGYLKMVVDMSK